MWYVIIFSKDTSKKNSELDMEKRKQARSKHLERCLTLQKKGHLLVGGPFPAIDSQNPEDWKEKGFSGGLIIAEFGTIGEAEEWARNDPYVLDQIFSGPITIKPWFQTIGIGVEFGRGF